MFTKEPKSSENNNSRSWVWRFFVGVALLLLFGIAGFFGYMFYKTRQELEFLSTPAGQQKLAERETELILGALGKLVVLPEEEPVIATISDAALLATQSAFYQGSENGDKLVVFPQAQRAFIYSPARNIIINAGPLVIDQDSALNENVQTGDDSDNEDTLDSSDSQVQPGNTPEASL